MLLPVECILKFDFTLRETNKVKEKEKDRHKDVTEKREETSDRSREKRTKERKEDREDRPHSGKVIRLLLHVFERNLTLMVPG